MFQSPGESAMFDHVPSFLVESYLASQPTAVAEVVSRARRAAELGEGIKYLHSTYVPADETCLHLFAAPSAAALGEAAELAGLGHLRIVEAVETGAPAVQEAPA